MMEDMEDREDMEYDGAGYIEMVRVRKGIGMWNWNRQWSVEE